MLRKVNAGIGSFNGKGGHFWTHDSPFTDRLCQRYGVKVPYVGL
jgi:hypothetical protein